MQPLDKGFKQRFIRVPEVDQQQTLRLQQIAAGIEESHGCQRRRYRVVIESIDQQQVKAAFQVVALVSAELAAVFDDDI